MEADFQRHQVKVSAEKELWERTQTHSRELEEEIVRKRKDLTMVLDQTEECGRQLESVEEQLDSQRKLLETQSSELVSREKELQALSLDIDLREQAVISLNNDMESKAKELENVQTLIEERSAHCKSFKLLIEEHSEELVSKEKRHDEITDAIRKLSFEIVFQEKTLGRAQAFIKKLSEKQDSAENKVDWTEKKLNSTRRHLERCIAKHKSKKKELRSVKDRYRDCLEDLDIKEKELKSVESILTERDKQVEEGEKMMQHLSSSIEELMGQLKLKQEEVCSINQTITECSGELKAKMKQRDQVQSSLTDLTAELSSVKKKIQDSLKDLQSKEVELKDKTFAFEERAKKVEEAEARLVDLERKSDGFQMKVEAKRKELNFIKNQVEVSLAESNAEEVSLSELRRMVEECAAEKIFKESELSEIMKSWRQTQLELERYHAQVRAEMESLRKLDEEAERKLKDLTLVEDKIAECEKMFETRSSEVVSKEKELEVLSQKIDLREQTVMSLNSDMKEACQRMENIQKLIEERSAQCESLELLIEKHNEQLASAEIAPALTPVNNVLSLDVKPEEPINNSVASHLPNEDALLRDIEDSTSLSLNEVSTELPMFKDPGRFILTSVEKALTDASERGELSLKEPILMALVPLLEELTRVGISTDPGLQSDATKVAREWVRMMEASVEKSQLEAWGFLQFILAFGLVKGIKQDETLQLASHVAHFRQAPKLFESLGLTHVIPSFVTELLNKAMCIPAARFMFYFKVENKFSPLELLKEQINNLRLSQAEANRDAATLRDIMELIEDFKFEIDIPVDLIFKFMVPRDFQILNQRVQSAHMQASNTVFQNSCIATDVSNPSLPTSFSSAPNQPVETYEAGGSTEFQGQSSHQAGFKRPRGVEDPEGSSPVIRPCINRPPGFGRF
ncbi:PREDICTED: myosin-14-like isoform X2 [Brassica oleracea var. oleracea]|uniref:myosin-14-like isoform X1 n=1 Tax=Brassica oleracea var. oleracea TaxID=109376 RepID=UPI0006A73802|nr:PREDICTED: myosin-14-like isoform X1 [Brassica oleracea var. oleracea]XP_013607230.1 PREDICTED: myosin-14-like isoform X2 [Brassica oleracea var. oleracea]